MSVVIRDMEKPDSCQGCMFENGDCMIQGQEYETYEEQYANCPLEEWEDEW